MRLVLGEVVAMTDVKLWRYYLPSINGEGWAIIVLGSDGFFSAVSDFGNYAHLWSHHGCRDFREFMATARAGYDNWINKLSPGKVYDGDATCAAILGEIQERLGDGCISADHAESERTLLEECENVDSREMLFKWREATELEDLDMGSLSMWTHPPDVRAFCQKTLPRLAEVIRAEIAAERIAA